MYAPYLFIIQTASQLQYKLFVSVFGVQFSSTLPVQYNVEICSNEQDRQADKLNEQISS